MCAFERVTHRKELTCKLWGWQWLLKCETQVIWWGCTRKLYLTVSVSYRIMLNLYPLHCLLKHQGIRRVPVLTEKRYCKINALGSVNSTEIRVQNGVLKSPFNYISWRVFLKICSIWGHLSVRFCYMIRNENLLMYKDTLQSTIEELDT
jgi:hypothetical protein